MKKWTAGFEIARPGMHAIFLLLNCFCQTETRARHKWMEIENSQTRTAPDERLKCYFSWEKDLSRDANGKNKKKLNQSGMHLYRIENIDIFYRTRNMQKITTRNRSAGDRKKTS